MNNYLQIGDTGRLNSNSAAMTLIDRAEVIKLAQDAGDVYGFRDLANGNDIFTSEPFTFYRNAAVDG